MMTNLSYTNNETRFLDKVINWYKSKTEGTAKNTKNSKNSKNLKPPKTSNSSQRRDNQAKTDRRVSPKSFNGNSFFSKRFSSPKTSQRKRGYYKTTVNGLKEDIWNRNQTQFQNQKFGRKFARLS